MSNQEDAEATGNGGANPMRPTPTTDGSGAGTHQEGDQQQEASTKSFQRDERSIIERMQLTDWFTGAGTVVIAFATIWNVFYVGGQLWEMQADQRPWLSMRSVTIDLASTPKSQIHFIVTNTGHSPNNGIGIDYEIVSPDKWWLRQIETCKKRSIGNEIPKRWEPDGRFSVVPGRDFIGGDWKPKNIDQFMPTPHVVGCITYRWHNRNYRSGFVGQLVFGPNEITADHLWTLNPE